MTLFRVQQWTDLVPQLILSQSEELLTTAQATNIFQQAQEVKRQTEFI